MAVKEKHPNVQLILVPDRGKEIKAAEIAAAVGCQWVELPQDMNNNDDVNDYALKFGYDNLANLLESVKHPETHYKLLFGDDLCNAAPMSWIVRGVIPAEGLAALYGASGSGKSFLVLDMACAIASGAYEWFGLRVTQAPVTYVCLEGEAGLNKRIKAWCSYHKKTFPNALRFVAQSFNLLSDDISELAKAINLSKNSSGLVVIDTLNRAAPGADENSSVDMGNIIAGAKKLQNLIGGIVLLVHHTGKDTTKGLRGHSSLYAALDGAVEVIKSDSRLEWNVAKSKDDVTGGAYPFKLEVINIGTDEEGESITSCVATTDENGVNGARRTLLPKSGNQKIIWNALCEIIYSSNIPEQAEASNGKFSIQLEEAIIKTRGLLPCEKKRQTERAKQAITGLISRGLLEHRDGWLWIS
jgi:hypothetical protein